MDDTKILAQLPSRCFEPRIYGVGAWTDNLHFACDLMATLRPRTFVELGTDRGESYFAFCQSALENKVPTRSFAIDTWLGDEQTGGYDETTFAEVSAHNALHYESSSTLLRCRFDEARPRFALETIDLLHLDGLHTEEAARHDIESWLPAIVPGGILLLHDVNVRTRDFGVWKIWQELQTRGRSYTFATGPGLGVWQKPPARELPVPLETLLNRTSQAADQLGEYYRERALELQAKIARQWRDGSIRETAAARQTTIQVFYTHDGIHREEDSSFARIGHRTWKDVAITLPPHARAAPLRIDFYSAYTTIDLSSIRLTSGETDIFRAETAEAFEQVAIAGDAERQAHANYLRLKVTGPDPQLYLPILRLLPSESRIQITLRLRVTVE